MNKYPIFFVLAWLAMLVLGAPLGAQGEAPAQPTPTPVDEVIDPEREITIDFVQKDLHIVMHYIGLRSGLNITVEGSIAMKLTVIYRNVKPKQAIRSICESNELLYVENGNFIYIKSKPGGRSPQANVVEAAGKPGRFNVTFESHELIAAIMETAKVTGTNAFVPATINQGGPPASNTQDLALQAQLLESMARRKVSVYMREATPADIFGRLKDLGGMNLEKDTSKGFVFSYPVIDLGQSGSNQPGPVSGPTGKMKTLDWTMPAGVRVGAYEPQLRNMISPRGRIVYDDNTGYLMITDVESNLNEVATDDTPISPVVQYMNKIVELNKAQADKQVVDPMVVKSYVTKREVSDPAFATQLQSVLSTEGRVVVNPDRNSIVIFERQSRMADVDAFIRSIDTTPEQVQITSQLVEVTLDKYMGYGLQWFTDHGASNLNNGRFTGSSLDTTSETAGGMFGQPTGFGPYFATFINPRINLRLEALANEGKARTLIRPSCLISNKKTGKITVGQEVPYLQATSSGGGTATASVSFKEIAIVMEVTPTILGDGLLRLDLKLTIKEQVAQIAIEGNTTPVLSNREAISNVFIRDSETLAIGGLLRERTRTEENGIPILKDIPILGVLFKAANVREEKTDVLFFLTPQIHSAYGPATDNKEGKTLTLERELRPSVADNVEPQKLNWLPSQYATPGAAPRPAHWDKRKTVTNPKDVNAND
ncbi:MAG: hypothetical protein IT462_02545 [Planctomycetes bacterium]|nr:hypothetical protein [Planctomycetota bacterium]